MTHAERTMLRRNMDKMRRALEVEGAVEVIAGGPGHAALAALERAGECHKSLAVCPSEVRYIVAA